MLDDPLLVAGALAGTVLDGREVRVLSSGVAPSPVLVVDCGADEVLAAWASARQAVDRTARWPVVVTDWNGGGSNDLFSRFSYGSGDQSPLAVCHRAETVDLESELAALEAAADAWRCGGWDDWLRSQLERTAANFGRAPALDEAKLALGIDPGQCTLERWLFEWELAAEANGASPPAPYARHLDWFVPEGQPCAVVLLPTIHGWQAPAWLAFFGAEGEGRRERLVAVMRTWDERWGAELVAHWGTMLEFVVARPPTTVAEAFPVAVAHDLLARSTLRPAGLSVRDHARALVNRTSWFLHDRP